MIVPNQETANRTSDPARISVDQNGSPSAGRPRRSQPIGWYVHLPFCRTKCGYCDFYSLPTLPALVEELVRALCTELDERMPEKPISTLFVGGGTPTELPAPSLRKLLSYLANRASRFAENLAEWTVEANPSSTTDLHLDILRESGVTRVSFGAQSFDADELRILERIHDPSHIAESVRAARHAGFLNINLDLMYAIPGQTLGRWRDTLRRAIDLGTDHLSCYALMYEHGTALTRQRNEGHLTPCNEDLEADMFQLAIDELIAAGFEHYEISNFAKPGRSCLANLIYWHNGEYLGIGPSAVSYLDGVRRKNVSDVRRYCERMTRASSSSDGASCRSDEIVLESECLSPRSRAAETAVQMLRLVRGINARLFSEQTGFNAFELFNAPIQAHSDNGLIHADADGIRLTPRGLLLANRVMQDFLIPDEPNRGDARALPVLLS